MRYEALALVHEIHSASVLFSIYFSLSVMYVYIKEEQPKRKKLLRETKACQMTEADILSS